MGAWGPGNFENDWALDWIADLRHSKGDALVTSTLAQIIAHGGTKKSSPRLLDLLRARTSHTNWLKANLCAQGLAAAEVVAARIGHPAQVLPDSLVEWLREYSFSVANENVRISALKAVQIIKTNSELQQLWDEGSGEKWHAVVEELQQRLGGAKQTGT